MAELWKGAPAAAALTEQLAARAQALKDKGVTPALAVVRIGERPDDAAYENAAAKRCDKAGIAVHRHILPADCGREQLLDTIRAINADDTIHGCLMLRPLPDRAMEAAACALLRPEKDVDGMTAGSLAAVFSGTGAGFPPCTAEAVMVLLDHYGASLSGKRAAVLGRSLVIGRPAAMLLLGRDATVTVCHTKTTDAAAVCRASDIVIAAAGKAGVMDAAYTAPGQIVIDVGIHVGADGAMCGDVKFDEVEPVAAAITPVPGGVGAVTTAVLAKHVVEAAERAAR